MASTHIFRYKGHEGYLVIDNTINGRCFGGFRILPDVTLDEITLLARCMTLKYGFLGIKKGGAKAGLRISSDTSPEERSEVIMKFGESIKPLLNESYWTGFDMGCSIKNMEDLMKGAGRDIHIKEENHNSHYYTALTIFECIRVGSELKKINLNKSTCAIEGFGNVGLACAEILSEAGSKIVAISTVKGAIFNKNGLDINKLKELKEKYGDDLVNNYKDSDIIDKAKIFELDIDILIPCARTNSINENNFDNINAKIISIGGNGAVNPVIDKKLFNKNILVFPDFIANCGGVLGSVLKNKLNDSAIKSFIETKFHDEVKTAFIKLIKDKKSPSASLSKIALDRFLKMKEIEENKFKNKRLDKISILFNRVLNRLNQEKELDIGLM